MNQDMVRKQKKYRRTWISFAVILFLLLLVFFSAINTGSLSVSFGQLLRGLFVEYDENVAAVYDLRFPRILISMLAGAAIAVSGVLFQAVLKNPLADPGIIGISSGAGFAAVCVSTFFPTLYFFTPFAAFFGGVAAFFLVYCLSWKQGLSPLRIILTGVAVDALFTGLSSIFSTMTGGQRTGVASIVEANITQKTWSDVGTLFPYVLAGLFLAILFVGECNLLSLEDKTARGLGINVNRTRIVISLTAVLLASVSTAVAGAVSFLGLIVPHIGRLLVGSDHKVLIPFSTLAGAFTFLLADTIGRTIAAPYEVSAAVIMSVVGGPFFILLLRRSKKYGNYCDGSEKLKLFLRKQPDSLGYFPDDTTREDHDNHGCERLWEIYPVFSYDQESDTGKRENPAGRKEHKKIFAQRICKKSVDRTPA